MPDIEALDARAIDMLGRLVAFDTTSRGSNLALIEFVEAYVRSDGTMPLIGDASIAA